MDAVVEHEDFATIMDVLQILGVPLVDANRFAYAVTRKPGPSFIEAYGQGRMVEASHGCRRSLNCNGLSALDLRTLKPDGTPWDFSRKADRDLAEQLLDSEDPDWIVGSPPCTAFCSWNVRMNYPKMGPDRVRDFIREGRLHLRSMIHPCMCQAQAGRDLPHDHPQGVASWRERESQ